MRRTAISRSRICPMPCSGGAATVLCSGAKLTKAGAARSNYQHIVRIGLIFSHQKILQSLQIPMAHMRM